MSLKFKEQSSEGTKLLRPTVPGQSSTKIQQLSLLTIYQHSQETLSLQKHNQQNVHHNDSMKKCCRLGLGFERKEPPLLRMEKSGREDSSQRLKFHLGHHFFSGAPHRK